MAKSKLKLGRAKGQGTAVGSLPVDQAPDGNRSLLLSPLKLKLGRPKTSALGVGTTSGHPQCDCHGFYFRGNWHHGLGCPETAMLWRVVLGELTLAGTWPCPHCCTPEEVPSGWTHPAGCPFWLAHPGTESEVLDAFDQEDELPF